jgi:hypothetical protein
MDDHPFHAKTKVDPTPSETLRRFYHSNCYFWFTMFQLILTLSLISIVLVDLKTHQKHRWTAIITIGTQNFYSLPQRLNFFHRISCAMLLPLGCFDPDSSFQMVRLYQCLVHD